MTCICNFEDERNKIANFLNLEPISKQSRTLCTASLTFEINKSPLVRRNIGRTGAVFEGKAYFIVSEMITKERDHYRW